MLFITFLPLCCHTFADDDTRVKLIQGKNDFVNANYVTVSFCHLEVTSRPSFDFSLKVVVSQGTGQCDMLSFESLVHSLSAQEHGALCL